MRGNHFYSLDRSDVDIDSNDNARLDMQFSFNRSNGDLDFDEVGSSFFRLEDLLDTNKLDQGAIFDIDGSIEIVPAGKFFPR